MHVATRILGLSEDLCYLAIQHARGYWATTALAGVDVALAYKQDSSFRLQNNLHPVRIGLNVANLVAASYEVYRTWTLRGRVSSRADNISAVGMLAAPVYAAFRLVPVPLPNQLLVDAAIPEGDRQSVRAELEPLASQAFGEGLYLARIVMNCVLAHASPENRLLHGWNIAAAAYGFFKSRQLKWLTFTRQFHLGWDRAQEIAFKYQLPLLSPQAPKCVMCCGDAPQVNFCSPHTSYDLPCLIDAIFRRSASWRSGSFQSSGSGITAQMSQNCLLKCDTCNAYPPNPFLEAQGLAKGSTVRVAVTIAPDAAARTPEGLFSLHTFLTRLRTVSTVFQAGLAIMHERHPELARNILPIQTVFHVIDLRVLVHDGLELYSAVYEWYVTAKVKNTMQAEVQEAQTQLDQAEVEVTRLEQVIDEDIESGNALKIYRKHILVSAEGRRIAQEFDFETDEMNNALIEGDILTRDDPIPLCHEAVSLITAWKQAMKKGENIALVEDLSGQKTFVSKTETTRQLAEDLNKCLNGRQIVFRTDYWLPLPSFEDGTWKLDLKRAKGIPLTPEATDRLKQYSEAARARNEAKDNDLLVKTEAKKAREQLQETRTRRWKKGVLVGSVATLLISPLAAYILRKCLLPAVDWTEILKKIDAPADVKVSWLFAGSRNPTQIVMPIKFIVTLALTLLSSNKRDLALTTLLHSFTVWQFFKKPWIQLQRTFLDGRFSKLTLATVSYDILLPNVSDHFAERLKGACDYASTFFHEGTWTVRKLIETVGDVVTSRQLLWAASNLPLDCPDGTILFYRYLAAF